MAIVDNRTSRGWLLPDPTNKIKDDVVRLIAALEAADGDVTDILMALGQKAALEHTHAMSDVTGLTDALEAKRNLTDPYALDDLSDVNSTGAATGQVLIRQAGTWIPINLQVGNIVNLEDILNLKAPLNSPELTGIPKAPTASPGTNTTQIASTAFVTAGLAALKAVIEGGVSAAFDTLQEIATAVLDRVAYSAQTKTAAQKGQARANIDAGNLDWNSVINGRFDIAQRPLPVAIGPTTTAYGPDCWAVTTVAGISCSFTRVALSAGHPRGKYFAQAIFTGTGASGSFMRHKIEGVDTHSGEDITLTFAIADNVATAGIVQVRQFFGTGGSPDSPLVVNYPITISPTLTQVQLLLNIPSIVGKNLGTNGDDYLEFLFIPTVANDHVLAIADVSATRGDNRGKANIYPARSIAQEMSLCRRRGRMVMLRAIATAAGAGNWVSDSADISDMRATPSISTIGTDTLGNCGALTVDVAVVAGGPPRAVRAAGQSVASGAVSFAASRFLEAEL